MNRLNLLYKTREAGRILANAKNRDLTGEERLQFDDIIDQIDFERRQASASDPAQWPVSSRRRRMADTMALMEYLKRGDPGKQLRPLMRLSAEQGTDPADGGYTIPETVAIEIELAMKHIGGMWQACRHVVTMRGSKMPWPLANDTENYAVKVAESSDLESGAQAAPFGISNFESVKYTSKIIRVSNELLEDSDLFLPAFIDLLAARIFRGTNIDLSNGTGVNEPNGLTNAAVYGGTAAADDALTFADLNGLVHAVDPAYRGSWMFHDSVLKYLKELKNGDNYMFPELWITGELIGYPYVINNELPAWTGSDAGKKIAFFGDFQKYVIRTTPLAIRRMVERHGENDQTSFVTFLRVDGDIINAGTNPIKYLRMSST